MDKLSLLGKLNFFILQWFFVRLARILDDDDKRIDWALVFRLPLTNWEGIGWRDLNPFR